MRQTAEQAQAGGKSDHTRGEGHPAPHLVCVVSSTERGLCTRGTMKMAAGAAARACVVWLMVYDLVARQGMGPDGWRRGAAETNTVATGGQV